MPPGLHSRYFFTEGIYDAPTYENLRLTDREPYRFRVLTDTTKHVVKDGDTLFHLAAVHYKSKPRAAGLWWVIADFQPTPILDPTLVLAVGSILYIPSLRVLDEEILSEKRRSEVVEDFL